MNTGYIRSKFQEKFNTDGTTYTGEQIRDALLDIFPKDEHGLLDKNSLWFIATSEDENSFVESSDLERLIPNSPSGKFEVHIAERRPSEGDYPRTEFKFKDSAYICSEQYSN